MPVADFLDRDSIVLNLASDGKEAALRELVDLLASKGFISDAASVTGALLEREKLGSTGIGEGVAIPHGKFKELDRVVAAFGRSRMGVDFDAMDGEPVNILFLLLAPENNPSLHLKALARVARLLKSEDFRADLLRCKSADELYKKLVDEDEGA